MTDYALLADQAASMIETEPHYVAALSNMSALIYESMDRLNWAGFYMMDKGSLLVGPFQGRQRVADVHAFPGHIACDAASRSEIVLPIRSGGRIVGVLDIDSPEPERFSEEDEKGLALLADLIGRAVDFAGLRT